MIDEKRLAVLIESIGGGITIFDRELIAALRLAWEERDEARRHITEDVMCAWCGGMFRKGDTGTIVTHIELCTARKDATEKDALEWKARAEKAEKERDEARIGWTRERALAIERDHDTAIVIDELRAKVERLERQINTYEAALATRAVAPMPAQAEEPLLTEPMFRIVAPPPTITERLKDWLAGNSKEKP